MDEELNNTGEENVSPYLHQTHNRFRQFLNRFRGQQGLQTQQEINRSKDQSKVTDILLSEPLTPTLTDEEIEKINEVVDRPENKFSVFKVRNYLSTNINQLYLDDMKIGLSAAFGSEFADKVVHIPYLAKVGVIGLYDGIYQKLSSVNVNDIRVMNLGDAERGSVDLVQFGNEGFVVKRWQGTQEPTIAKIASEKNLGPQIYGPGGIELIEDYLPEGGLNVFSPQELGIRAGSLLRGLHDNNIIYNDAFTDHLRLDPRDKKLKLIDFGISSLYDEPPPDDIKEKEIERLKNSLYYCIVQASKTISVNTDPSALIQDTKNIIDEGFSQGYYPNST